MREKKSVRGPPPFKGKEHEYEQLSEDWRHYDNLIWQTPTATIAIISGMLYVAYALNNLMARRTMLVLTTLFTGVMCLALYKHRYFQNDRTNRLEELDGYIRKGGRTGGKKWVPSAYWAFQGAMIVTFLLLLFLTLQV